MSSKKDRSIKNRKLTPYYPNSIHSRRTTHRIRNNPHINMPIPVYNENDYNSNDGMLTSIWGPGMWHYLHTMSFNYPVNPTPADKENYRNFVLSLQNVLPCGKCRKNLVKNFKKLPLTMDKMNSRATFSKYIYDLHEVVNKMLGKNSKLTYDMVRERYEHFGQDVQKDYVKRLNNVLVMDIKDAPNLSMAKNQNVFYALFPIVKNARL